MIRRTLHKILSQFKRYTSLMSSFSYTLERKIQGYVHKDFTVELCGFIDDVRTRVCSLYE